MFQYAQCLGFTEKDICVVVSCSSIRQQEHDKKLRGYVKREIVPKSNNGIIFQENMRYIPKQQ
jgi:hypothetical protein